MALMNTLQNVTGSLELGALEKASIYILDSQSRLAGVKSFKVQFNPDSYKIQRRLRMSRRRPVPVRDSSNEVQAISYDDAVLSVQLVFDTYTEYGMGQTFSMQAVDLLGMAAKDALSGARSPDEDPEATYVEPLDACSRFIDLIRFQADTHTAPRIAFVWGSLNFQGVVVQQAVNYTMFSKNGTPVRVGLDLAIVGEESRYLGENAVKINESPDRTKRRVLEYGETLWMMADREYGNVGEWKTIAQANGILNPRKLGGSMSLKVPSTR